MSRNDAIALTERLYARIPAHYRVHDAERGYPLLALVRVIGEQAAVVRANLDALRDDFFIETCDDWVVPYLASLLGSSLLSTPVGHSNRLEVLNTVAWRRAKGTPRMLASVADAVAGWRPTGVREFFQSLGWSQHLNHLGRRLPLMPDLRDPLSLARLGLEDDPLAHAADFAHAGPLDQPRAVPGPPFAGDAWGTPGRHQIRTVGFFVRRLQTFRVQGVTPAAVAPGNAVPPDAASFTFDPLLHEVQLFGEESAAPLTRAALEASPWPAFGTDLAVRRFGVLLASPTPSHPDLTSSQAAFDFGGAGAGMRLHAQAGMRLMGTRGLAGLREHFVITAEWHESGATTVLGEVSTRLAARGDAAAFQRGAPAGAPGRLAVTVRTGHAGGLFPALAPASGAGRLPAAAIAIRLETTLPWREADAIYVYLPAMFLAPGEVRRLFVARDGSTYESASMSNATLARASEGQVYPPVAARASRTPARLGELHHQAGIRVADASRFAGAATFEIGLEGIGGPLSFQLVGTVSAPAFAFAPSAALLAGDLPVDPRLLTVRVQPAAATAVPPAELLLTTRGGARLLVYLPEVPPGAAAPLRFFVADDGSTFAAPTDVAVQQRVLTANTFSELTPARASAGQVLPIEGAWPLQHRVPVSLNLCRPERRALLHAGELGIDPELGRFAFAPGDPAIGQGGLSVDYVEAFSDRVGALTFDRQESSEPLPNRLVASSGDADLGRAAPGATVHSTLAGAVAASTDGDIIEIADSATYIETAPLELADAAIRSLTIRSGARQRPCLAFSAASSPPAAAGLRVRVPMSELRLTGLLVSGGAIVAEIAPERLEITACTIDPRVAGEGGVLAADQDRTRHGALFICRSIVGGVRAGGGVDRLAIADSIVDRHGRVAIGGLPPGSPPASPPAVDGTAPAVHLERVTVFGRIHCERLDASECLLDDVVTVEDQQAGCVRFTRYERGSILPRRFHCVPDETAARAWPPGLRPFAPLFNSRRFGRPDYAQLAPGCPPEILQASELASEVGAFTSRLNPIRLANLRTRQREFMPAGLSGVVVALT